MRVRPMTGAIVLSFVVSLAASAGAAPAGATAWQKHMEAGLKALMRNDLAAADRAFEGMVPFIDRKNEDPELLFDDFAAVATGYLSVQEAGRATVWAQRALTGMEKLRGPVHIDLVQPLTVLATARMAEEKVIGAASLVDRACRVSWTCGQKPDEALSTVTGLLAAILQRRGQDEAAQELLAALAGTNRTSAPHLAGRESAAADWFAPPATKRGPAKGTTGTATPEALKRYERLKKFVSKKQARVGQLEAWFETNADPAHLQLPDPAKEALRREAGEHWRELTNLVANVVSASEFLKAAVRSGDVGPEQAAKDQAWLEGLLAKAQRAEGFLNQILGTPRPGAR